MGLYGGLETSKKSAGLKELKWVCMEGLETSKESLGLKELKWVCMEGWRLLKGLQV